MALSKKNVDAAIQAFRKIGAIVPAHIQDTQKWDNDMRGTNHAENTVYGFDKKIDGGWESIYIVVKNSETAIIDRFNAINSTVSNSSTCKKYWLNEGLTIMGWY